MPLIQTQTPLHQVEVVTLTRPEELSKTLPLQDAVWGPAERVTVSTLVAAVHSGGVALAAQTRSGEVVGFCFGFPGWAEGRLFLWSQRLAVDPRWQGKGIGTALKQAQRGAAARLGYPEVRWSFDPLRSRNAHLNLNKLGARGLWYLEHAYGERQDPLNQGLPSDRLVVSWPATSPVPGWKEGGGEPAGEPAPLAFPVEAAGEWLYPAGEPRVTALPVRIPIPADLDALRESRPDLALAWRLATRKALQAALALGGQVVALEKLPDPAGPGTPAPPGCGRGVLYGYRVEAAGEMPGGGRPA